MYIKTIFTAIFSLLLLNNCNSQKTTMDFLWVLLGQKTTTTSEIKEPILGEEYEINPYIGFPTELQAVMSYKINQDSINPMISHLQKDTWKRLNDSTKSPIKIKINTKITYGITDGTTTEEVGSYNLEKTGKEVFNPSLTTILSVKAQEKFAVVISAVYDGLSTPKQNNLKQLIQEWQTLKSAIKDNSKKISDILDTDSMAKVAIGKKDATKTDITFINKQSTLKTNGETILSKIKEQNEKAGKAKKPISTNLKKGYHNTGFMYFYYPKDNKIYYLNKENTGMNIYKMDLDGQNSTKAFPTKISTGGIFADARYLYIKNDILYYSGKADATVGELSSITLDGTTEKNYGTYVGMMKIFGNKLYFFQKNSSNYDLYSLDLSSSGNPTKEVDSCNCYVDGTKGGNFYVKDNTIYYSDGVVSHKEKTSAGITDIYTKLSPKANSTQNLVFAKDFIYYRASSNDYGIGKSAYDNYSHTSLKDTIEQLNEKNALNVSEDWIVYYGRGITYTSGSNTHGLYAVSIDDKTETKLTDMTDKGFPSLLYPSRIGEIKIIGDWAYYILEEKAKEYTIYRVKKDGTGKAKVKTITLP